jgi:hypothetical protein
LYRLIPLIDRQIPLFGRGNFASDPNEINYLQGRVLTCEALKQAFLLFFSR